MILRNKICLFALITTLLSFAFVFRHLAVSKLSPIIRIDTGIKPPPLAPDNVGNDTVIPVAVGTGQTGHTHYDEKDKAKEYTLEEWLEASEHARLTEAESIDWTPIKDLCSKTVWRDDLIFECLRDPPNTRATVLSCVRYAIDAGATVYFPMFHMSTYGDHLSPINIDRLLDYWPLLDNAIDTICPGFEEYPRANSALEDLGPWVTAPVLHPDDLPHWSIWGSGPVTSVKNYVHQLVEKNKGIKTLIPFGPVSKYYPICQDDTELADLFGKLLSFGGSLHKRADDIFWHLYTDFSVPITPGSSLPEKAGDKEGFLAIRFETPSNWIRSTSPDDAGRLVEPTNIPSYEAQRDFFLKRMRNSKHGAHGLKVVYVSAEEGIFRKFQKDIDGFSKSEGESLGLGKERIVLVRAEDFVKLEGNEGRELERVSRDVLDQLVLLRSEYFLGIAERNVGWEVANRRRTRSKAGSCGYRKPWIPTVWGSAMLDEFSDLMGDKHYDEEWKAWP